MLPLEDSLPSLRRWSGGLFTFALKVVETLLCHEEKVARFVACLGVSLRNDETGSSSLLAITCSVRLCTLLLAHDLRFSCLAIAILPAVRLNTCIYTALHSRLHSRRPWKGFQ